MASVETIILKAPYEVDARLAELGLTRDGLLKVRAIARAAAADATPFHPANASGTLSYQHGTFGLRDEYVGDEWEVARPDGVEVILNNGRGLMVAFSNVDVACNDFHQPKPRSQKGAGSERVAQGSLFGYLPQYAPRPQERIALYYLMVAENGATELTRPVVQDGTFIACVERLYLLSGDELDHDKLILDDGDSANNFDPLVIRKSA